MKILHQNAGEKAYRFLCYWIFGIWLGHILLDPLTTLAIFPHLAYNPAGFLLKFLPKSIYLFPVSFPFLFFLKSAMIVSLLAVILDKWKKWAGLFLCVLLSIYEGIVRSFGHINHPEMSLLISVFILTVFFFYEDKIKAMPERGAKSVISLYGIPFVLLLFFFGFTYCFAGIHRIVISGLDIYTNDTLTSWVLENGRRSRIFSWHLEDMILTQPWLGNLLKLGFPVVTIFEVLAPFCLVSKWIRYAFLVIMIPFHIFVWLFMGIFFWGNLTLMILFFDFTPLLSKKNNSPDKTG